MDTGFRSWEVGSGVTPPAPDAVSPDPLGALPPDVIRPWARLLGTAIESEILPRLLAAHRQDGPVAAPVSGHAPNQAEIAAFVQLIVADDVQSMRAIADRVIVQCGGRDALLHELLTPAARMLGDMWSADICDFMTVTLGVYRLDQIMKETATACCGRAARSGHENRILLLPAPGEQHSFGLGMVADAFREGGWCVRSGPAVTRAKLSRLARDEWFDVVGLSVTSDRHLKGLAACLRAIRAASCNPSLYIMLGGRAIMDSPERTRFLGADGTARDARQAVADANFYIETTVTEGLHRSKTRLVDIG